MTGDVTLEELRELSARSRRTAGWGMVAVVGALMTLPALALVASLRPGWYAPATWLAMALGGALLLRYAFVAGEERGAFRKVFRRARDEARARRVPVSAAAEQAPQVPVALRTE